MRAHFGVAMLVSACLLFLVQPMAAKMLLPSLGGSPAVWITCMVFFQALLLAGYGYAHVLTRRLSSTAQVAVHGVVLALPLLFLPLRVAPAPAEAADLASPARWLLLALTLSLAVPFFVVATTAPLLQRWFSATDHPDADHPYSLYAMSNAGSFAALLAYPLMMERWLPLRVAESGSPLWGLTQSGAWSLGYAIFALLAFGCGLAMLRRRSPLAGQVSVAAPASPSASIAQRVRWVLLAAVPSSVMLGATQYLTTDVAAVPLLWVVPLALYLLTFIVAFSRRLQPRPAWTGPVLAVVALGVATTTWGPLRPPLLVAFALHLTAVAAVGLVCHGRLCAERPHSDRLTEFYAWIAVGGLLGGVFNALVAPLVFTSIAEYPLAVVAAAALRPASERGPSASRARWADALAPLVVAGVLAGLAWGVGQLVSVAEVTRLWIVVAAGAVACAVWIGRPRRFALALLMLVAGGWVHGAWVVDTLHVERTFFGVVRVARFEGAQFRSREEPGKILQVPMHVLLHGTTRHGTQLLDPKLRLRATTYFHISGPIGHLFRIYRGTPRLERVGVVGLGAGTLAVYGEPGQRFTFYEIDPAVARVAADERYFTYLRDCRAEWQTVVGDGRIALGREDDGSFGLIVIDAYSSDAIPVHLITREALQLYFSKLRPDGLLILNVTNQYFDLPPVLATLAADLGLHGLTWTDLEVTHAQRMESKEPSTFVVLARESSTLLPLRAERNWRELASVTPPGNTARWLWTDNASSLLSALR